MFILANHKRLLFMTVVALSTWRTLVKYLSFKHILSYFSLILLINISYNLFFFQILINQSNNLDHNNTFFYTLLLNFLFTFRTNYILISINYILLHTSFAKMMLTRKDDIRRSGIKIERTVAKKTIILEYNAKFFWNFIFFFFPFKSKDSHLSSILYFLWKYL